MIAQGFLKAVFTDEDQVSPEVRLARTDAALWFGGSWKPPMDQRRADPARGTLSRFCRCVGCCHARDAVSIGLRLPAIRRNL